MKIGVYFVGSSDSHHAIVGRHMIETAKRVMPDVPVIHLTDETTEMLAGADDIKRGNGYPMAALRMKLESECEGDWLFVDTDVVFQKDVRDVFNNTFDVALADRPGGKSDGGDMPYNLGVAFSKNPQFFAAACKGVMKRSDNERHWMGDQFTICRMVRDEPWKVKILPGEIYNFTPTDMNDARIPHAAILHFKGARKRWLGLPGVNT